MNEEDSLPLRRSGSAIPEILYVSHTDLKRREAKVQATGKYKKMGLD
jgi:hypothetical protein